MLRGEAFADFFDQHQNALIQVEGIPFYRDVVSHLYRPIRLLHSHPAHQGIENHAIGFAQTRRVAVLPRLDLLDNTRSGR